jgi:hypothetical protein
MRSMTMASRKKTKQVSASDRTTAVGRDLIKMHRFAADLLDQHGLTDWSVFWVYSFDNNKHGGGVTLDHAKRIVFSAAQVAMFTPAARRDAVRHEVAHALVGVAAEHSDVWKQKAIELGSSGADAHQVSWSLYPWYGLCPDGHEFVSIDPPGTTGFLCEDKAHDKPAPVERFKRNAKSRAFDPGVKKMVETYPEPVSVPEFQVGDTVYVIPYGSDEFDNAPLTVLEVGERNYSTRSSITGDEIQVRHEMVRAAPDLEPEPDEL